MPSAGLGGIPLLLGRVLFGAVIVFMGLNHFVRTEEMVGYAEHKGVPAPNAAVLGSGAVLFLGGLGVVLGVVPVLSSLAIAAFLLVAAVLMHDFWAVPEDQKQDEMTQFLKNVALAGGALGFATLAAGGWAYSVGVRLV